MVTQYFCGKARAYSTPKLYNLRTHFDRFQNSVFATTSNLLEKMGNGTEIELTRNLDSVDQKWSKNEIFEKKNNFFLFLIRFRMFQNIF